MYVKLTEFSTVITLYEKLESKNLTPTYFSMNAFLESSIKMKDNDLILKGLDEFHKTSKLTL